MSYNQENNADQSNKKRMMQIDETNSKDQFYLMRQKMKKLTRQSEEQTEIMKRILDILNDDTSSIATLAKCPSPTCTSPDRKFSVPDIRLSVDNDIRRFRKI